MSALQALEVVADQLIEAGAHPGDLATIFLDDCENLAMPGLALGMLVRNLERAGEALDSFLIEPCIWRLESERYVAEHSMMMTAPSDTVNASARRKWTLRKAAMLLVLRAEGERIDSLRELGERLIERASTLRANASKRMSGSEEETSLPEELAAVHTWAAVLNRSTYQVIEQEGGLSIQPTIPDNVVQALKPGNQELSRVNQATDLIFRYAYNRHHLAGPPKVSPAELRADLVSARDLLADPLPESPSGPLAAPAAVAAGAIELFFVTGEAVANEELVWSMQLLVEIAQLCASMEEPIDFPIFSDGPDRSAARGMPFVFLPTAAKLRAALFNSNFTETDLADAARWLATIAPLEVRLLYAKAMDLTWRAPCNKNASEQCHHNAALKLMEDSARDCLIGRWDVETQRHKLERLDGPLDQAIATVADERIVVPRLSPAIRALGVAANSASCCTIEARALLATLLEARRRGVAAHKRSNSYSADDALVVARALLVEVANGREVMFQMYVKSCKGDPRLLTELLQALSAAGEENEGAARAALHVWPKLIDQVLDEFDSWHDLSGHDHFVSTLAALIPRRTSEGRYLRRELDTEPIEWTDVIAWRSQVERWLSFASGRPKCIDSLVLAIKTLERAKQVNIGLPWIEVLVKASPERIALRCWHLPDWLRELQPHARCFEALSCWQRIVDMLVVSGDTRVSDLSD